MFSYWGGVDAIGYQSGYESVHAVGAKGAGFSSWSRSCGLHGGD